MLLILNKNYTSAKITSLNTIRILTLSIDFQRFSGLFVFSVTMTNLIQKIYKENKGKEK